MGHYRSEAEARRLFRLCSQSQWSYERAKQELAHVNLDKAIVEVTYRPFDNRWTIWDSNIAVHRRERVMNQLLKDNIAITTSRQAGALGDIEFNAVLAVERPVDFNLYRRGGKYVFPVRFYSSRAEERDTLAQGFRKFLEDRYDSIYGGEEIAGYIYAVLHSHSYRKLFAKLLLTDFPRIPFPLSAVDFETLSRLGWTLVEGHLLRPSLGSRGLAVYAGKGDHRVESVRRTSEDATVWINRTQGFRPVPQEVWDFRIGGYQVLDKYLKSRKGRQLSLDEITHVARICDALAFTIEQMARIDAAYLAAFPDL
jgi:predicted helicase